MRSPPMLRLITSQDDTAPKPPVGMYLYVICLITSQDDTAPKRGDGCPGIAAGLITSQDDTAPKRERRGAAARAV